MRECATNMYCTCCISILLYCSVYMLACVSICTSLWLFSQMKAQMTVDRKLLSAFGNSRFIFLRSNTHCAHALLVVGRLSLVRVSLLPSSHSQYPPNILYSLALCSPRTTYGSLLCPHHNHVIQASRITCQGSQIHQYSSHLTQHHPQ
jgi:hypothetical protein